MQLLVKSTGNRIESIQLVVSAPVSLPTGYAVATNAVNNDANSVTIGGTAVPFDRLIKNLKYISVTGKTVVFASGYNYSSFDDSKIGSLDTTPMSFVRANTVVNFGRL